MADPLVDPVDTRQLEEREAQVDGLEIELSFEDAQLRGRERLLAAQREALEDRARWLDEREHKLADLSTKLVGEAAGLEGLGQGKAMAEADVEGYVAKSSTLHLGRAAMLAAREEMLVRRRKLVEARRDELLAYEQAFARAEVRLSARERLVAQATVTLEKRVAEPPGVAPSRAEPKRAEPPKTVDMLARDVLGAETFLPPSERAIVAELPPSAPLTPATGRATTRTAPLIRPAIAPAGAESAVGKPASTVWSSPQPRTKVMVDQELEAAPRHAETQSMNPEEGDSVDAQLLPPVPVRRKGRPTPAPSLVNMQLAQGVGPAAFAATEPQGTTALRPASRTMVPDDLPDAPRGRSRHPTSPFVVALSVDGHTVLRHQIEFDRAGQTVLVSFSGPAPALGTEPVLAWRARDGEEVSWPAALRRMVPSPPRGSVAILSVTGWNEGQLDAFERALAQVL